MNFSYVNTIEDYVEADKITRSINTLYKFFGIFLPWFIFSMVGVVLFFDIKSSGGTFAQLLCIVLTILVVTLYYCFRLPERMDKAQSKKIHSSGKINKMISFERDLVLTEEKLLLSIKDQKVEIKLDDIGYVIERDSKLFVIHRKKSVVAIIPITIFSSSIDKSEFISKVTSKAKK